MPITDAIIIAAIVFAFIVFGVVLAWGEYQTRHLTRPVSAATGDKKPVPIKTVKAPTPAGGLSAAAN